MAIFRRPISSRRGAVKSRKPYKARQAWTAKRVQSVANSVSSVRVPGIRRPDFGFPDRMVTKLRYVDNFNLTGAAGVVGANVFRFNSCFDPDLTGVGHQPMYFDQFAGAVGTGPYGRYRVISAKATVSFMQTSPPAIAATNVGPIVVGLQTSATSGLYATNLSGLCEASNSTWTQLGDKAGGNNVKSLTATYYPRRDLGVSQDDDTVSAAYNGNPSQVFHLIPWKIDTIGAAAVTALVEIIYTVEFFDRNEVAQS
jgi:hypothetical protein